MTTPLAVFVPQLGRVSETFIRRHIEDLRPGKVAVVAGRLDARPRSAWRAPYPTLFLDAWALRPGVRLAARAGFDRLRMRDAAVANFLQRAGVEIVLGEYLDYLVEFVPLLQRLGLPYIVQGHGIDVSAGLRKDEAKETYRRFASARAVLTRCEFHRRRLIGIGLPSGKIHVNPGGVDVPAQPMPRAAEANQRFLAIGRMVPKKGPIYLLEAFRLAAAENRNITLDYVGSGELLPAAAQFVDACGLAARVRLHGAAAEEVKQRLLEECGVFVQHSITDPETGDEEGLPAAIQEAMAHGMAVISTRHSGIPDAVAHGTTGWLVEEGDVSGMAREMLRAAADANGTRAAGAAGHARALAQYRWQDEKARLLSFLGDR